MKKVKFAIFIILLYSSKAHATSWYVSLSGVDHSSTAGTISAPLRTIKYAVNNKANPGDTVFVRAGIFYNTDFGDADIWNGGHCAYLNKNGSSGNYITVKPYQNEIVKFKFDGTTGIRIQNSSFLRIEGFEIEGNSAGITISEAWANWGLYKINSTGEIHDLAVEMGITPSDPALFG